VCIFISLIALATIPTAESRLKDVGQFTGGIIPAILLALITKNPEALGAGMSASAGSAIEEAGSTIEAMTQTQHALEETAVIDEAEVDQVHKAVDVKDLWKIKAGDIKAQRIKPGTNGKIAVIGRSMQGGVLDYANELRNQGCEVEVFDGNTIPDDAIDQFDALKREKGWLSDKEIVGTKMYKSNEAWVNKLLKENYTIIDIGNPIRLEKNSIFYEMEKNAIFGE